MKPILVAAAALVVSCSKPVAVLDLQKTVSLTAEAKTAQADIEAFMAVRKPAIEEAQAEAKKLKDANAFPAEIEAAQKKADDLARATDADVKQRQDAAAKRIVDGLRDLLPAFVKRNRIQALAYAPSMVYVDPAVDVSAELAAAYDTERARRAGLAETDARVKALEAKLAAAEARQQAQTTIAKK